ncbi:MAG: glycosyltransferase family 4 protein [Williamsia sp.]|nr:glycosyltransferase family 4 protein [Williamsia sp.]
MAEDKLTIGIIVDTHLLPTSGGGFTYYYRLLQAINAYNWNNELEIVNIIFHKKTQQEPFLKKRILLINKNYIYSVKYLFYKILYHIFHGIGKSRFKKRWLRAANQIMQLQNRNTEKILAENHIDLVYYLRSEETSMNYPFMTTHWDVGHRSMYAFPEVALNGNYETRENYYLHVLNKAFLVICESETGAKELLHYYNLNPAKVKTVPIFSGGVIEQQVSDQEHAETLTRHGLEKNNFFLYPAQFWVHKNHYNLLQAFKLLLAETKNSKLKLLLCGSDKGNMTYIKQQITRLGLSGQISLPGYISDRELFVFYKNARALVMPTFLGPTNMPLLEAAELECPVLCSDLPGHHELMGDTALYFNPACAADISRCMHAIQDASLRRQLTTAARERIAASPFRLEKSLRRLEEILLEAMPIRKTWGYPIA